jgi:hypothetical protein
MKLTSILSGKFIDFIVKEMGRNLIKKEILK